MTEKVLSSGWVRLKVKDSACFGGWAQVPVDYNEDIIADEYIFQPEWNRQRINKAWKLYQSRKEKNDREE